MTKCRLSVYKLFYKLFGLNIRQHTKVVFYTMSKI